MAQINLSVKEDSAIKNGNQIGSQVVCCYVMIKYIFQIP
jgi:hypothetical protein